MILRWLFHFQFAVRMNDILLVSFIKNYSHYICYIVGVIKKYNKKKGNLVHWCSRIRRVREGVPPFGVLYAALPCFYTRGCFQDLNPNNLCYIYYIVGVIEKNKFILLQYESAKYLFILIIFIKIKIS